MALEALKDLFITNLLPDGRRLVPFESRPLRQLTAANTRRQQQLSSKEGGGGAREMKGAGKALLMWYFEDQVRGRRRGGVRAVVSRTAVVKHI